MRCGQADNKRATAVGGVGGDAAGDPAGGVAGGGWGDAAGGLGRRAAPGSVRGLGRRAAPGLTAYLLVPRRDAWAKALMAPACFVAAYLENSPLSMSSMKYSSGRAPRSS